MQFIRNINELKNGGNTDFLANTGKYLAVKNLRYEKNTSILLLAMAVHLSIVAKDADDKASGTVYGRYFWKYVVLLQGCDKHGALLNPEYTVSTEIDQIFDIIYKIDDKSFVIEIVDYSPTPENLPNILSYTYDESGGTYAKYSDILKSKSQFKEHQRYFLITKDIVDQCAVKDEYEPSSLTFGVLSLPFKFRFKPLEFSAASSIDAAIGFTFKKKAWKIATHSLVLGAGFTQVNLDKSSVRRNDTALANNNNFNALAFCLGYMLTYNKVQVGFFAATDILGAQNNNQYGWRYQGQPYFSIGLGYSLFSQAINSDKKGNTSSKQNE